ncbi:MAG: Response regulator receiver modulated diguanylate cyclase [Candidatus Wolfebacteria bacterium GW2011_GWE1_48_7]|uniref:Response regulator receiver modulated diguanylate cyclase n=2 Tax=Candidatus Wolfeibacteriota TaxID=1752735 RepID=A0A0G1U7Z7_9BACT|nr:MAG: response regulator receiver modulated diguanylate cyclase, two-component system, cell cycle response regulator [Candidatus Wolfebacteria bacterium GW2011_GWB1_47_1]KKU37209.1 MAG: Response regulator receiver modulated diguanylate cyclase [Candidatus Wolfebacteria bacterium GW2011_GWC2_46_275]KKU42631.1 MAG: Response regulator receiver modulated diguanylate cyclase [Candidatus Wolfebacteria bacterium GW2011_GWB2_46_69]KKU54634.1 MAG: Response regulator receiver modulated diguanylate cycla
MDTKKVVLVVDDVPEIIEVITTVLSRDNIESIVATSGHEGIDMAKKHKPNLILLDFKMPDMDGAETLQKLRQDPETKDIKVIFLTAFGDIKKLEMEMEPEHAAVIGNTPVLQKGGDIGVLRDTIRKYLEM